MRPGERRGQEVLVLREEVRLARVVVVGAEHGRQSRVAHEARSDARNGVGPDGDVRIDEQHDIAARDGRAEVPRPGRTSRLRQRHRARAGGFRQASTPLAGAVEHDDDFSGTRVSFAERAQALPESGTVRADWNDHRHARSTGIVTIGSVSRSGTKRRAG